MNHFVIHIASWYGEGAYHLGMGGTPTIEQQSANAIAWAGWKHWQEVEGDHGRPYDPEVISVDIYATPAEAEARVREIERDIFLREFGE